jgi:hypothetical protein
LALTTNAILQRESPGNYEKLDVETWNMDRAVLVLGMNRCFAPLPMVTGGVPTPEQGTFESYAGVLYQKDGPIERNLPFTELVYGITERLEVWGNCRWSRPTVTSEPEILRWKRNTIAAGNR